MSRKYWNRVGNARSIDWNAMEKRNENRACSKGNKTIQTGEFLLRFNLRLCGKINMIRPSVVNGGPVEYNVHPIRDRRLRLYDK